MKNRANNEDTCDLIYDNPTMKWFSIGIEVAAFTLATLLGAGIMIGGQALGWW